MEGRPVLLPFVEGGDKEVWRTDIDALCNRWKSISVSLAKLSVACWLIRRHASALTELPFMRNFSESEQDRWASMAPRRLLNVSRIQFIQTFIEFSIPTRATHAHRVPLATRSCKGGVPRKLFIQPYSHRLIPSVLGKLLRSLISDIRNAETSLLILSASANLQHPNSCWKVVPRNSLVAAKATTTDKARRHGNPSHEGRLVGLNISGKASAKQLTSRHARIKFSCR